MCVNIGHGDARVIRAIQEQAATLAYVNPFMATEPRARLGVKLAEIAPGDIDVFFFTSGGSDANENAIKLARLATGRHKILARYRSYHGATAGSITLTGDPRRWAAEPGLPGVVHVLDPYHGIERGWDQAEQALSMLEEVIQLEGPHTIAAFILEPVTGTNGILAPPDGYLQGVRELCTKHGILMICDEVMSGFGRTGEWFAVNHWNVVPDLLTMAKGLTSAYVQLGAVGMRRTIADHFKDKVVRGGARHDPGLRRRPPDRERPADGSGHEGADGRPPGAAPVGRRGPIDRPVRHRRARARSRNAPADGAVQRHVRRDEGDRLLLSRRRAVHVRPVEHVLRQPAAQHHRARAARGVRHHRSGTRDHGQGGDVDMFRG